MLKTNLKQTNVFQNTFDSHIETMTNSASSLLWRADRS